MRPILRYSDVTLSQAERELWNTALLAIRSLPPRPLRPGRERAYAHWLSTETATEIFVSTRDELSQLLAAAPRNLSRIISRPPSETLVNLMLATPPSLPLRTRLETWAGHSKASPRRSIRDFPHFTATDAKGQRQEFVAPHELPMALSEIARASAQFGEPDGDTFFPLWALVAVLNAHFFDDGNGRLARAWFNAILIDAGVLRHAMIPLGPLIYCTQGNFELAAGRAAVLGDWSGLIYTIGKVLEIYASTFERFEMDMRTLHAKGRGA